MKIAILIAGPYRYTKLLQQQLTTVLNDIEYETFIHIWKEDLGNKVRHSSETHQLDILSQNKNNRILISASPTQESFYRNTIGTHTNSNSSINATMGMFSAMSQLCWVLSQQPDVDDFTHVLRLRTDSAILSDKLQNIANKIRSKHIDPYAIYTSVNPSIPDNWISDHVMLTTRENYCRIWKFDSIEEIYRAYKKGKRNPERTLAKIVKSHGLEEIVSKTFFNNIDYAIVRDYFKESDPEWITKIYKESGPSGLFLKSLGNKGITDETAVQIYKNKAFRQQNQARVLYRLSKFSSWIPKSIRIKVNAFITKSLRIYQI